MLLFPHPAKPLIKKHLAEGLVDIRQGRVHGPFQSVPALLRSLLQTKKNKKTWRGRVRAPSLLDFSSPSLVTAKKAPPFQQRRTGHPLIQNLAKHGPPVR